MNPNAASFQFVPGQVRPQASSFAPRDTLAAAGAAAASTPPSSWDEDEGSATKDVVGFKTESAPKTVSLSIGSKPATPKQTPPATPKLPPKETPSVREPPAPPKPAAAAKAPAAAPTPSTSGADAVLKEQQSVADQETLDELYAKEGGFNPKSHVNVVFIGHVDAGKSTLGGQLLFLTGMVDKRTMEKYEKDAKEAGRESWYLSWALDSTQQEREKGKTVETGRAYFETETRRYTLLDAPGHKTYVPSMISGAAQADVAILVISARKGEFETGFERGGQTREHAMLVKTAGVQRLVVVINKMDEPTVKWEKERFDDIVSKLTPYLRATGFNPKTDITFIPVSAYTGQNLKDRVARAIASWSEGPSLLEFLDGMPLSDRRNDSALLMPISEKYNDMGTMVVGKIESGRLRKGSSLLLMPNKSPVEVSAISNEQEEPIGAAQSGDNVRIRLRGVTDEDVSVGFVLCEPRQPVHTVSHFEAELVILESKNIICAGYSAVMHVHTLAEEVTLSALLHYFDKKTGRRSRKPPQFAIKGQKILALIEAAAPVCIEPFKHHPQLGRFTLRDEGKTIAIGKVTKLRMQEDVAETMAKLSVAATSAPNGTS